MTQVSEFSEVDKMYWHLVAGRQYKEAFWILAEYFSVSGNEWNREIDMPAYHSAGLALEHFLKCYLGLHGITYPENVQGHNLVSLLSLGGEDLKKIFNLTESELVNIETLNKRYHSDPDYGKSDLRYISRAGKRISPHPDFFYKILTKLENRLNLIFIEKFKVN